MVSNEFVKIVEERLEQIRAKLASKGQEYVRGDNVFHNFVQAGIIDGVEPLRALHGMFLKHYVSFRDIITDVEAGKSISKFQVDEKLGDMINYLILAEGLLIEYINESTGNSNT